MSEEADIAAYFERIGFAGSMAPTAQTLELLHARHPAAIPFENLDPLLAVPVRLELSNLQQKLLFEKRGGYCLEHNLLLKAVLETLGFPVRALGARVHWGHREGEERPVSHVVLAVDVGGATYLADVGFGGLTLTAPLRLKADVEQATPHETFRLMGGDPVWRLQVQIDGEWRSLYGFEVAELPFETFQAINDSTSSSPKFRDNLMVARADKGRRFTLDNASLRVHATGGETTERRLGSLAELKEVLTGVFGLPLPAAERLDPALERILAGDAA